MKKTILFINFVSMLLLLTSCTKVIYTAQQNMSRYRTKQDIVNILGLPNEKRTGEGIEEWLYNYGTVSTRTGFGTSNTSASVYGNENTAYGSSNTYSTNVTQFSQYNRFIKFTLDDRGNVIKWESHGVDLAIKQTSPLKTVLFVLGCLALGVGLGIASGGD